jgi:predicted nucleic acid-binding protein
LFARVTSDHTLVLCSRIIDELYEVFNRKFSSQKAFLDEFLAKLPYDSVDTPADIVAEKYPKIRDESDLPILASAIIAKVDILITGDKDFYEIDIEKPRILSPSGFMNYKI